MGSVISSIKSFFSHRSVILVLGLDGAGKTTLLYHFSPEKLATARQMIGLTIEVLDFPPHRFISWDTYGYLPKRFSCVWREYYKEAQGLIYMVDSNDIDRLEDSAKCLREILESNGEELANIPLWIFLNKNDLPGKKVSIEMARNAFQIDDLMRGRRCLVSEASCLDMNGVNEGLLWLRKNEKYETFL